MNEAKKLDIKGEMRMKTIVVYRSKSGFVKKYADWIAEELSADIYEASKASIDMLTGYDTIIYGGGLYAVGINGVKLITKNMDKLKDKNLIVFTSGASPYREEIVVEVKNKNFTLDEQKYINFFYMRGGFDYNTLTPIDKVLMVLLKLKLKMKKNMSPDDRGMLAAYSQPVDFTKKRNISKLVNLVRSL